MQRHGIFFSYGKGVFETTSRMVAMGVLMIYSARYCSILLDVNQVELRKN